MKLWNDTLSCHTTLAMWAPMSSMATCAIFDGTAGTYSIRINGDRGGTITVPASAPQPSTPNTDWLRKQVDQMRSKGRLDG